jgi:hypothetical protein
MLTGLFFYRWLGRLGNRHHLFLFITPNMTSQYTSSYVTTSGARKSGLNGGGLLIEVEVMGIFPAHQDLAWVFIE